MVPEGVRFPIRLGHFVLILPLSKKIMFSFVFVKVTFVSMHICTSDSVLNDNSFDYDKTGGEWKIDNS